jgi:hypothetical protein
VNSSSFPASACILTGKITSLIACEEAKQLFLSGQASELMYIRLRGRRAGAVRGRFAAKQLLPPL